MPNYVMLSRFSTAAMRSISADPTSLLSLRKALEAREAKILTEFQILGEWDHCTIFEASDNFRAYHATLDQESDRSGRHEAVARDRPANCSSA